MSDTEAEPIPITRWRPPTCTTSSRSRGPSASERRIVQSRALPSPIPGRIRRIAQMPPHNKSTMIPRVSDSEPSPSAS